MKTLLNQLNSETFILDCEKLPPQLPPIENITLSMNTTHTTNTNYSLEIKVPKTHNISHILAQLTTHNIIVKRIQSKANRLEELFIKLTETSQ